jgi:hypothetical protein
MCRRSLQRVVGLLAAVAVVAHIGAPTGVAAQLARVPIDVELEGCILPAPACEASPDVIPITVQGEKRSLAVIRLSIFSGHRSSGGLIDDMKFRGMRVFGPEAAPGNFPAGAQVQMRALAMMDTRTLLLRSVVREGPRAASERAP